MTRQRRYCGPSRVGIDYCDYRHDERDTFVLSGAEDWVPIGLAERIVGSSSAACPLGGKGAAAMSQLEIERVIGRAAIDVGFRQVLLNNARQAGEGYDLTEDELVALEQLDLESLMAMVGTLDRRISDTDGTGSV